MTIQELYQLYQQYPKVSKDTREKLDGAIYFSIRGDRFDGNAFASEALKKGAAFAVIDDLSVADPNDNRYIHVSDALKTLQNLAAYHRLQFQGKVIGITGSNGKTTTKELLTRILRVKFSVSSTPGNYNNHIGIPLMLLQTSVDVDFVVVEMGASRIGDIASYCKIAKPDYGLITNVGKAHLETFGGEEGVRQGKGELYTFIAQSGKQVFLCPDEKHLERMAKDRGISHPVKYYESDLPVEGTQEFRAHLLQSTSEILFEVVQQGGEKVLVTSQLQGRYNFRNILAGMAVGNYFGVSIRQMAQAIQTYRPDANRSESRIIGSNEYYLDAYNANPTSMMVSLQAFHEARPKNKVLVIGDMLELGNYAQKAHQDLVDYIASLSGVTAVFLVGQHLLQTKTSSLFLRYKTVEKLKKDWEKKKWENQHIFLKGSRSIRLEKLLED